MRLQARLGVEWSQEPHELGGEYSCGGRPEGVIRVRRSRGRGRLVLAGD